tara:strand:+ start:361 stop:720 length:360 start_codon:yes stop_codon:yes gene_type:complete
MSNYIQWDGGTEDGRNVKEANPDIAKWSGANFLWSDFQLLEDLILLTNGKSGARKQEALDQWLDEKPDKKKRLIKLIATVGGKNYTQTREVEEVQVKVDDVELLIKEVFSRLIVEKKDV